uniref:Aminoglycoside phosphotransferase domain-containing protein n=1 Tax=Hucho hucho TaxID=62062 RepID=A0A4W5LIR3_9TELE
MGLQVQWWTQQYRDSETPPIPAMERLIQWLPLHLPKHQRTTQIHGSFRLENLVFHPEKPEVVAVMDWGRSRLGDPLTDLTFSCMAHCLPQDNPLLTGTIILPNRTTAPYQAHGYKTQMAPYSHVPWSKIVHYIGCHLGYSLEVVCI